MFSTTWIPSHAAFPEPLPPGETGRLAVRGPTGCRYLDDPERQRLYVQNGWNLTGDAYRVDEDGWFWYQARTDDLIVSAGYRIGPTEVESVLNSGRLTDTEIVRLIHIGVHLLDLAWYLLGQPRPISA